MKICPPFLIYILLCVAIQSTAQTSFKQLDSLSKVYKKKGDFNNAILLCHQMKTVSKDKNEVAKVYYKLGLYHRLNEQTDSSFISYNLAKNILLNYPEKDSVLLGKVYQKIAIAQSIYDDFSASDISAIEGLKYLNGRLPNKISSLYNCLGLNSSYQEMQKQAIDYYEKAIETTLREKDKEKIQNNIALSYRDLGNYKKAISIFKELLNSEITKSNPNQYARVIDNLAETTKKQNSKANILPQLLHAKKIREKNNDNYGLIASYTKLTDYFYEINQNKSKKYAERMLKVAIQQNTAQMQIEAYDRLLRLNRIKNRKYISEKRKNLSDSLQTAKQITKNKYARIKFNSDQNEKQALVYQQIATQNKYQAEKEKNQKNNILYFSTMLMIGLFGYGYYRKQQLAKEKVQEVYNTEQRLAKKIHDELANDVYRILSKAQTESLSENYIDDLNAIYLKTRDISHEHQHIETGANFAEELKHLFEDFHTDECRIIYKSTEEVDVNSFSKEQQIVLYRVLQELLVNVKKHSEASFVVIQFSKEDNHYKIRFKDNGKGTNTKNFKKGLRNTETRIELINGTITFESAIDKGFEALIKFKK